MFVNPIIMFIIFFGSLIVELVDPLEYGRYRNVSCGQAETSTVKHGLTSRWYPYCNDVWQSWVENEH